MSRTIKVTGVALLGIALGIGDSGFETSMISNPESP